MTAQNAPIRGPDIRLVALVFAAAALILVVRTLVGRAELPFFADSDDAMRMVMVQEFLSGQPWYDLTAHRLNTPFGAELHWSRLIDLPLALLQLAFAPLLGTQGAMVAAGYAWPMLLLALLLWLSALLAQRLVGPDGVLPALVLPVLSPAIVAEFTPGRVDHHNVVILLTLAIVWTGIEAIQRPRFAIACGLCAATALAIATESLPTIAAAILVMGLLWVAEPARGRTMRRFGLAFAAGTIVHLAIFRPPSRWFEAACDVLSPVYVAVALVVALAFTIASLVPPPRTAWQRLFLLGVLAIIGMAAVAAIYPQCLRGPYGELDPWLQRNWIANIVEARPWHVIVSELPAYAIAVGVPALLATVVVVIRLLTVPAQRAEWAALLVFLVCTALVMLAQVRGARLAVMPAMPAAAWLIVPARQRYLASPQAGTIAGLVLSWLAFSGVVLSLLAALVVDTMPGRPLQMAEARASKEPCLLSSAFTELAALPSQRIMAPIDLGAYLMLHTPHEVVSAPYHRNQHGVRDTYRFINDPIDTARSILDERDIGLVVLCPPMAELQGLPSRAEDSFANLYAAGELPAWLQPVTPADATLEVFAVLPERMAAPPSAQPQ